MDTKKERTSKCEGLCAIIVFSILALGFVFCLVTVIFIIFDQLISLI